MNTNHYRNDCGQELCELRLAAWNQTQIELWLSDSFM